METSDISVWLSGFHFLRPLWLTAVPLVIGFGWWLQRVLRQDRQFDGQVAPHLLRHLTIRPVGKRGLTPTRMIVLLWLISILALAGPTFRRQPTPFADDEAALMMVVRVSESMLNRDLQPSRLERARVKLASLLEKRGRAGSGLVAYNGTAHLVMPVTDDPGVINHMLEALDPKIMPREGDALWDALELAESQLKSTGRDGSILVVTDSTTPFPSMDGFQLGVPVQFFALAVDPTVFEQSGISEVADQLRAPVQAITSDDRDLDTIVSNSRRVLVSARAGDQTAWRDDGYYLVPLLALGGLMWARLGWIVGR
ncbi:MAG: VWA domain-containing protein [Planctomycetota bacterium]